MFVIGSRVSKTTDKPTKTLNPMRVEPVQPGQPVMTERSSRAAQNHNNTTRSLSGSENVYTKESVSIVIDDREVVKEINR